MEQGGWFLDRWVSGRTGARPAPAPPPLLAPPPSIIRTHVRLPTPRFLPPPTTPSSSPPGYRSSYGFFFKDEKVMLNRLIDLHARVLSLFSIIDRSFNIKKKKFSSVQFKMVCMRLEKPICAPPRLSEVSPTLSLKRFQC